MNPQLDKVIPWRCSKCGVGWRECDDEPTYLGDDKWLCEYCAEEDTERMKTDGTRYDTRLLAWSIWCLSSLEV